MKFSVIISVCRSQLLRVVTCVVISFLAKTACNPITALSIQKSATLTPKPVVIPSSTLVASTLSPTKTIVLTSTMAVTFPPTITLTPTEGPPIFEAGGRILIKLEERCLKPLIYKGSYQGVSIPVQLSTDNSYIDPSVELSSDNYANRLSEAAAGFLYYWWWTKNMHKTIDDFMSEWKKGTVTDLAVSINNPSNTEYKPVRTNINIQSLRMHIVFVDSSNWKWRGKLSTDPHAQGEFGIYISGSEMIFLVGVSYNHMIHNLPNDPYGPQNDLVTALWRGSGSISGPHFMPLHEGSLKIVRSCR
jgi:hypothetical protein